MARSISTPIIAALVCVAMMLAFASAANYNMIVEPVNSATSFPVDDYAEFEYSYATADPDTSSGIERNVWIAFKLGDTELVGDTCYIGNGQVDASQYSDNYQIDLGGLNGKKATGYAIVRAPVAQDDFFQVVCRFKTPQVEQTSTSTLAYIGEFAPGASSDTVSALMDQLIDDLVAEDSTLSRDDPDAIFAKLQAASADVTVPDIFTQSTVFSFHYEFEPEGRKLLNSTEIDFIRQTHFDELNNQSTSKLENVLVADHYADLDYSVTPAVVKTINLILYTKGTTSQYDFKLGLKRRVTPILDAYSNPLQLNDLQYSVTWVYRSNCYNTLQDFGETGLNCGNPLIVECGHCYLPDSTCTDGTECASSTCTAAGTCDVSLGAFIERANAMSMSIAFVVALIAAAIMF